MEKEKSNTKSVILIIVIILLLAVIGVLVWMVLHPKQEAVVEQQPVTETQSDSGEIAYEESVVALDEASLEKAWEDLLAKQGTMALEMKVTAFSNDGMNYSCSIANSPRNSYDMYMILYLDETQEELYRSGLIPVGKKIDHFTVNRSLESGNHDCTLTYVQVEDDHKTTHATLSVGLTLAVE